MPYTNPSQLHPDKNYQPSSDEPERNVGLIVVHGIGKQKRGQTLEGVLKGLNFVYNDLSVQLVAEDHAIIICNNCNVHVFEVYWADLFHGEIVKGTFNFDRVFETVWFPLLNYRNGHYSNDEMSSRWYIYWWTFVLVTLSPLLFFGYYGMRILSILPTAIKRYFHQVSNRHEGSKRSGSFWERVDANINDPDQKRTIFDDLMDQVTGDVFNYVHGAAGVLLEINSENEELSGNVSKIHERFFEVVDKARLHHCSEIQILAHSLGSVIAYHSICHKMQYLMTADTPMHITRFYTIGSPLEKIRFFWPQLIASSQPERNIHQTMTWDNFFNRLDFVSGRLKKFPGWPEPKNYRAKGLGGMIRSHIAYIRNPTFLTHLGEGLIGTNFRKIHVSPLLLIGRRMLAALENLVFPACFVFLILFGLTFSIGSIWLISRLFALPFEWFDLDAFAHGLRLFFVGSFMFSMLFYPISVGLDKAKELHNHFKISSK